MEFKRGWKGGFERDFFYEFHERKIKLHMDTILYTNHLSMSI